MSSFRAIIIPLRDWVKSCKVISPLQNFWQTYFLHNFYVEKHVDKFGDNRDKSPLAVEKWRISSIMSC